MAFSILPIYSNLEQLAYACCAFFTKLKYFVVMINVNTMLLKAYLQKHSPFLKYVKTVNIFVCIHMHIHIN